MERIELSTTLKRFAEIIDIIAQELLNKAIKATDDQNYAEREAALRKIHKVLRFKDDILRMAEEVNKIIEELEEVEWNEA